MKSRRKMLSCMLMACMGTAIGFTASAATNDVPITPPPKPAFHTAITPGMVPGKDIQHGHHHKGDIKKNKSSDVQQVQPSGQAGGQS